MNCNAKQLRENNEATNEENGNKQTLVFPTEVQIYGTSQETENDVISKNAEISK